MLVQACPVLRYGEGARASGVCHSEEPSDEESQAIVRILRIHPDKRDQSAVHGIGESWVDRPDRRVVGHFGFFTAFRMTEGRAASVILRSQATKNPKPLCDCCVYILTNETHRLHMESESPGSVDLSAEWSEVSGFFTAFRMTETRPLATIPAQAGIQGPGGWAPVCTGATIVQSTLQAGMPCALIGPS